ncbi:hypothetical protein BLOT_011139 [Blomia tropicalis]|nr:hypothetical protein BLOT_011139 [Blomia tropicalis]
MSTDPPGLDYSRPNLSAKTWPIDDDIVISGISGRFPESDSMDELESNLMNHVDMVTCDDRRWPVGLNDNKTSRVGKLKCLSKFDNTYFCTLPIIADCMEPGSRIILETTYEAIADSGIAPQLIRGTRTGVYCGINTVACAEAIPQDDFSDIRAKDAAFWVYGSSKALLANRISFLFDLIGPSTVIDTACSSSLVALCNAVQDIRTGVCDMAIVATSNLCMAPYSSNIFSSLGLLAADGKCKVFDRNADGFVRSESVGAMFIQRRSDAKRVYATVAHAKTNTDGFKTIGLFAPFWLRQRNLMIETFQEAGIDPHQIKYFESHGTGTNVGDPQEAKAVSEAYCHERKDKLLVGAVKSNLGHAEGASGLCSVAKGIIILERRMIPANLHYQQPKPEIECLHRTIEPVVTNTPFDGDIIGVNSFGVGGVNAHVLLRSNSVEPENFDRRFHLSDPIPRLINICGRTTESIEYIFDFIEQNPTKIDRPFLALLNDSMKTTPVKGSGNFPYRGYMLIQSNVDDAMDRHYERWIEDTKPPGPLWLIFSGMGSQWTGMGRPLMLIDEFRHSIEKCATVLQPYGIDLIELIGSDDETIWNRHVPYSFVAITAMQIGLFDLIKLMQLPFDGIIGHSFGEIACAYADGCLTAEQAMLTSYWRGKMVEDSNIPKGLMAAVGLSTVDVEPYCTEGGVYLACHNGHDSVTVSGLYEPMINFMERLKSENIFVRRVAGGEYPYHSVEMNRIGGALLEKLNKVIPEPKRRSERWITTSVSETDLENYCGQYACGQYFVNNLQNPVRFEHGMNSIPKKAACIEIAPHSLFDSIFKRCYKHLNYIGLMRRTEAERNLEHFLRALGTIYTYGFNPLIERLYTHVEWPVPRGTQSISSLIQWEHSKEHCVRLYPEHHNFSTASNYVLPVSLMDSDWRFLRHHSIDGRIVFPATGYLMVAWRAMATKRGQPWTKVPIQFENVRICRPTLLNEKSVIKFNVQIIEKTGDFVVNDGNSLVCMGKISIPEMGDDFLQYQKELDIEIDSTDSNRICFDNHDIYKELRIRGYDYGSTFQGLIEADGDGSNGTVQWTGQWISFADSALHLSLLSLPIRTLFVPIGIDLFRCDPTVLFDAIDKQTINNVDQQQQQQSSMDGSQTDGKLNACEQFHQKQLKSEFRYFREMAEKNEILDHSAEEISEIAKKDTTIPFEIANFSFENVPQNERKMEFPVRFDFNNQILTTRGLEVKGLIPINIPRLIDNYGLMLEHYRFVPFFTDEDSQLQTRLDELYFDYCSQLVLQMEQSYSLVFADEELKQYELETSPYELESKNQTNKNYGVILKKIVDHEFEHEKIESTNDLIQYLEEKISDFELDSINNGLLQDEWFSRPIYELIAENCQHNSKCHLLELSPMDHSLMDSIQTMLKHNVIHKFELDCTIARHERSIALETSDANQSIITKTIDWNTMDNLDLLDSSVETFDLIVFRLNTQIESILNDQQCLNRLKNSLKTGGFLLTISRNCLLPFECAIDQHLNGKLKNKLTISQSIDHKSTLTNILRLKHISTRSNHKTGTELNLYRKVHQLDSNKIHLIEIDQQKEMGFDWIETIKMKIDQLINVESGFDKDNPSCRLWIISRWSQSGLLGFANCMRLESPYGSMVRIGFIQDICDWLPSDGEIDRIKCKQIRHMIENDLALNVYHNGRWGSYRFVRMDEREHRIQTSNAYLSQQQRGDLSSLQWYQSEHEQYECNKSILPESNALLCDVYYSALNFKDVVIASGKIVPGPESCLFDCVLGLEFSGRRRDNGTRIMGMVPFKGIATTLLTHEKFVWPVPDHWSLMEAATIPVVYITAFYALIIRGQLKRGESVLIHSGAGGVGQAAINICQSYQCTIYVTVGTDSKRKFIIDRFGLDEKHILNSRDTSFERNIKTLTNGRGVDVVLNSLTGDKLQASLRCVAINGRFLEIGKYDMQMNSQLGMFTFLQNITFHGVGLDCFFREGLTSDALHRFIGDVDKLIRNGIKDGIVRPIDRTIFQMNEVERAFRYMTTGNHIGKVLIQIREEEKDQVKIDQIDDLINEKSKMDNNVGRVCAKTIMVDAQCNSWFHSNKVYVIAGGLGGVGLELVYWMALKGARKFVLTSRNGLKSNFQRIFLQRFKVIEKYCSEYKIQIELSTKDISDYDQCHQLLMETNEKLGPIGGIFNLTLVLEDGMFSNQTVEKFFHVCRPKMNGSINLDRCTEVMNLNVDHFVTFSSFTAGRGNIGQTNYGYANSSMERIIERRNANGLNGIAIQFGPINDVGIVADHVMNGDDGTNEDSMKLMMGLEMQRINSCIDILNRILPKSKGIYSSYVRFVNNSLIRSTDDEVIRQLCIHLNIDRRPDDECLGDIGLDSMAAVEIQQRLERDFNISLSLADVRKITVKELKNFRDGNRHNLKQYSDDIKKAKINLSRIRFCIPTGELTPLNSVTEGKPFYCLPPLKGIFDLVSMLVKDCTRPVIALNWTRKMNELETIEQVAEYYYHLLARLDCGDTNGTYDLMATSFGALLIGLMCKKKRTNDGIRLKFGKLIIFDLLPVDLESMTDESQMPNYKVNLMFNYIRLYIPERICEQSMKEILELNCESDRVQKTTELMRKCVGNSLNGPDMGEIISNSYARASMMLKFHFQMRRKSKSALRNIFLKVMARNGTVHLEYIKLIVGDDMHTIRSYENRLKTMFDLETFERDFADRYRLHLVHENQDDLMDDTVRDLLAEIVQ